MSETNSANLQQWGVHLVFPAPSCPTSTTLIMFRRTVKPSANRSVKYSTTAGMPFSTTASGGSFQGFLLTRSPSECCSFESNPSKFPSSSGMDRPASTQENNTRHMIPDRQASYSVCELLEGGMLDTGVNPSGLRYNSRTNYATLSTKNTIPTQPCGIDWCIDFGNISLVDSSMSTRILQQKSGEQVVGAQKNKHKSKASRHSSRHTYQSQRNVDVPTNEPLNFSKNSTSYESRIRQVACA